MIAKLFEVRDRMTYIPMIAIPIQPMTSAELYSLQDHRHTEERERERTLMRRCGYAYDQRTILMTPLRGRHLAQCDPNDWGDRTFAVAHKYIEEHWDELESGSMVDVQFILGETEAPEAPEGIGWDLPT